MKKNFVATLVALMVLLVGVAGAETLEGVWILREAETPLYTCDLQGRPTTVISVSFAILVNPRIEGDRVYRKDGKTFFLTPSLMKEETPVYRIPAGVKSFRENPADKMLPGVPDEEAWDSDNPQPPYLYGTALRLKSGLPGRIYLTNDEWIGDTGWSHYFNLEDLDFLNPDCLPEVISEGKLEDNNPFSPYGKKSK